jgi:integrase
MARFNMRLTAEDEKILDKKCKLYEINRSTFIRRAIRDENLCSVGAAHIQKFLLYCAEKMAMSSVHDVKLHLKKLYAYLYSVGLSESSYKELLSFTVKRGKKIPSVLQKSEVAALLDSIDRDTNTGKRNYAVMLLGVVLGLRACDVVNLKLSDIDWTNGEIKILQAKTAKTVVLPLTKDVGEALQEYILNVRPKTKSKLIFFRINIPFAPLKTAASIGNVYRDCRIAAGLPANNRFHDLRRTLGTSMVTTGTPIATVAQVLGHSDVDVTHKYIALDSEHLKLCALSFEGIAPVGGEPQ